MSSAVDALRTDEAFAVLPPSVAPYAPVLNLMLAPDDGMMVPGGDAHYLLCGASALKVILAAVSLAEIEPAKILDFGAGAGRVTRWLRAAYPDAKISASELRESDVSFCRTHFADESWISGTDISALEAPDTYDLVWIGSVLTHLPEGACVDLMNKVMGWTKPGGLVVASTAGRFPASSWQESYIHPEGWQKIQRDYAHCGFGYADYRGHEGYGFTLTKPSWIATLVESNPDVRLVLQSEMAWDRHQDVVAVQNLPIRPHASDPSPGRRVGRGFSTSSPAPASWLRRALSS